MCSFCWVLLFALSIIGAPLQDDPMIHQRPTLSALRSDSRETRSWVSFPELLLWTLNNSTIISSNRFLFSFNILNYLKLLLNKYFKQIQVDLSCFLKIFMFLSHHLFFQAVTWFFFRKVTWFFHLLWFLK